MRRHPIKEEPFKAILDREWARAKRLVPALKRKPKVVWVASFPNGWGGYRSSRVGECWRAANLIKIHQKYKEQPDHKEFVLTLRHEFAHLLRPSYHQRSHGEDFMWWMTRLGGSRYAKRFKNTP